MGETFSRQIDLLKLKEMVKSAKMGNWDEVFRIIDVSPQLLNCIPDDRAWGVLHQAAWMNNVSVVKRLVEIPGCDPNIKTKQDSAGIHGPGKTPRDLTTDVIIKICLIKAEKKADSYASGTTAPTFVHMKNEGEICGKACVLASHCFNEVFFKHLGENGSYTFSAKMESIFKECLTDWVHMKSRICFELESENIEMSNFLKLGTNTMEKFFSRVIKLYTDDGRRQKIYSSLNRTLRLEGNPDYKPKGCDIVLSVYGLLLNAIIIHWKELEGRTCDTYRCVTFTEDQLSMYKVGIKFTWHNFTSSSINRGVATGMVKARDRVHFIIDNHSRNRWSPKYIASHSTFENEKECLYPLGATFIVTGVVDGRVFLKLTTI